MRCASCIAAHIALTPAAPVPGTLAFPRMATWLPVTDLSVIRWVTWAALKPALTARDKARGWRRATFISRSLVADVGRVTFAAADVTTKCWRAGGRPAILYAVGCITRCKPTSGSAVLPL